MILTLAWTAAAGAEDWSQYRGPRHDGSQTSGTLTRDELGLEVAWKRELGSGYSSISVAGDVGVTLTSDGTDDVVVAFDATTGEERWRHPIAATYEGHSGSDTGPISTPTIADGAVYALGPRGRLLALDLADGSVRWTRTLDESLSVTPHYGYATSPLVTGDVVVVQTGGAGGHSICAFDRASGELRWSAGDEPVEYQSPALVELAGRRQIVAMSSEHLLGLDPENGEVLWRHQHGTLPAEGFTQPLRIAPDRLVVSSLNEVVAVQVTAGDGGFSASEMWRSNALKSSYAVPVHHDGYLFGFSGHFLTALDASNGEVAWRSRPPGGNGLILVDSRLVLLGADGDVVVVAAAPDKYRELARLPVFDSISQTPPSFADGHVFVRNLSHMAAVRVTESAVATAVVEERELLGLMADLVPKVEAATDKAALIDAFMSSHETFPVVEDGGLVHLIYRGDVEDVGVSGNFLPFREEVAMDRIAGTDLYFKSFRVDPGVVWEYRFNVDYGEIQSDPLNPHEVGSFLGPGSELRMPEWPVPDYLAESDAEPGRLDSFEFHSDIRDNTRRIRLYLPAGYAASPDERYPLMVIHDGDELLDLAGGQRLLDNLVGHTVAPVILALVPAPFEEVAGDGAGDYLRMLEEELVPHLDKHYRTRSDAGSRGLMGIMFAGWLSLRAALESSNAFGKVALLSPLRETTYREAVSGLIEKGTGNDTLDIYVAWGRHDLRTPNGQIDLAREGRELTADLSAAGYRVSGHEYAASWGWSAWRAQLGDVLETFFPAPDVPEEEK